MSAASENLRPDDSLEVVLGQERGPRHLIRGAILLACGLLLAAIAGYRFHRSWKKEALFPASTLTRSTMLSEWFPKLKDTRFDTEVYIFDSMKPGGTVLLCGGTHPNEPAAFIASVVMLENIRVDAGRAFVIPRANAAAFTHNDAQEAGIAAYDIETTAGARRFRNGSRFTNPVFQWPDPGIYVNPRPEDWLANLREPKKGNRGPGGQKLGGVDSRNLNRVYPGRENGSPTERVAYAVMELIRHEKIDLAIDLHEASPEYQTINVIVAHQRALPLASAAELALSDDGVAISTDSSAINLRGLSHREWGDLTDAYALLMESANPAQGRLKGRTSPDQILLGKDGAYYRVGLIQDRLNRALKAVSDRADQHGGKRAETMRRFLHVDVPQAGIPISERAGRHIMGTLRLIDAYNDDHVDRPIKISGIPAYKEVAKSGVAAYLHGPAGQLPAKTAPQIVE